MKKGLASVLFSLLLAGCIKAPNKPNAVAGTEAGPTYFSMKDFILDQIGLLQGQPYTLQKIIKLNGASDTSIVALQTEDWSPVYAAFREAEIGLPKYVGRYTFSNFPEPITRTEQFMYEAKEPKLLVRRLMLAINDESAKVTSLLAETKKENFWSSESRKLYYAPLKVIQIQEENLEKVGSNKTFSVEYRFLRNQDGAGD